MVKLQPFEDFSVELDSGLVTLTESGKEKIESDLMQDKQKRTALMDCYNIKYEINKVVKLHEEKLRDILEQDKPYQDLLVSYMIGILHNKKYVPPIQIEHSF